MVNIALVKLWDYVVGAVRWDVEKFQATFSYTPDFVRSGLEVAGLMMPLANGPQAIYEFGRLNEQTFKLLPGMLADALPDRFGSQILQTWLAAQNREAGSLTPIERLCYLGDRGMGALEFEPTIADTILNESRPVDVAELAALAAAVVSQRTDILVDQRQLADLLRVGTSAGGARAKAVMAFNETTGEVRSGQVAAPTGFTQWLLKFDGVTNQQLGDPADFGRIEYAYYLMATAAGVEMMTSRLLEEDGRAHFLTRRFDRPADGSKLHMQTLCGLAHYDFNDPDAYSYEEAFQVMRQLRLPYPAAVALFRRMVFNVLARNRDDHTKNHSFLMTPDGEWQLAPAYDITYAYDPTNRWLRRHQLAIRGKREYLTDADFLALAKDINIKKPTHIIAEVRAAIARWPEFAAAAGVPDEQMGQIARAHRLAV